jgi:transposase
MTVRMTDAPGEVDAITSVRRRRRRSAAKRLRMVGESLEPGASVSLVARRHGVNPNQSFTWRRLAAHGAFTAAAAGAEPVPASDYRALQEQIRELHRLLGKKTLETEILREALQHADPRRDCCCAGHCRQATVPGEGRGQDRSAWRGPAWSRTMR